jgi:hypothetical protein
MAEVKTYTALSLLQPDNHAMLRIDYQSLQLVTACSHSPQGVIAAATPLARGARSFNFPSFLTTALAERQGLVLEVAALFPDQTQPSPALPSTRLRCGQVVRWELDLLKLDQVLGRKLVSQADCTL